MGSFLDVVDSDLRVKLTELWKKKTVGRCMLDIQPLSREVRRKPTLLAVHASSVAGNAVIIASGTDILVSLLGMIGRDLTSQRPTAYNRIIMDCGSGNSRRRIDVGSIINALEENRRD